MDSPARENQERQKDMTRTQTNKTRRGLTLTELAIVLGVVGFVLSAIWVAAGHVRRQFDITQAVENILMIGRKAQELYVGFPNAADPSDEYLIENGVFPKSVLDSDDNAINVWGGSYTFSLEKVGGRVHGALVKIDLPNTVNANDSIEICVNLAKALPGTGNTAASEADLSASLTPLTAAQGDGPTDVFLNGNKAGDKTPIQMITMLNGRCSSVSFFFRI
jgi:type II secretory pathway pseudopilin PulG